MRQLPLAISPAPRPTLASFVPGDNAAVLAHLQSLLTQALDAPGAAAAPPLYLWGPAGSGKTHLLQGLAADVSAAGGTVGWFDAADPTPWDLQAGCRLVVVDRCEHLGAAAQHAAFVLFTEAVTHGVLWAAAGTVPPADLPLRDDLRTRLAWGHVFALQALSEADTHQALADEACRRGLQLPAEVAHYLMSRFPRDLATLMALLAALDDHGLATQRRLTVPLVRDLIAQTR
jgi:DnaA family protein